MFIYNNFMHRHRNRGLGRYVPNNLFGDTTRNVPTNKFRYNNNMQCQTMSMQTYY